MIEEWRAIPDHEGLYEVSNLGRVRGRLGRTLQPYVAGRGYQYVTLVDVKGRRKCMVHRLMAEVWVPRQGSDHSCVCHKDNNKTNNVATNLRWDTDDGNRRQAIRDGLILRGEQQPNAILHEDDVIEIRKRLAVGERQRSIALDFGVSRTCISAVSTGRTWTHVGER